MIGITNITNSRTGSQNDVERININFMTNQLTHDDILAGGG